MGKNMPRARRVDPRRAPSSVDDLRVSTGEQPSPFPEDSPPSERFAYLFDVPPRLLHLGRAHEAGTPPPVALLPEPYQEHWVEFQLNMPPARVADLGVDATISAVMARCCHAWSFRVFVDPHDPEKGTREAPRTEEAFLSLPGDICTWLWQEFQTAQTVPLARSMPTAPHAVSPETTSNGNGRTAH